MDLTLYGVRSIKTDAVYRECSVVFLSVETSRGIFEITLHCSTVDLVLDVARAVDGMNAERALREAASPAPPPPRITNEDFRRP